MSTPRPTLGEALLSRLEKRLRRRPRIGFSPGFYARFGLEDPWLVDSFGGDPLQQEESFSHLSGRAFYAHLAVLGRKRWWRDRQRSARIDRLVGLQTAQRVRYPGEGPAGVDLQRFMNASSLASIALDMNLPSPIGAQQPTEQWEEESDSPVAWYRGRDFIPARVSRRPWHSVDHPGARVFGGSKRSEGNTDSPGRAMDRVGTRSIQAQMHKDPLVKDLDRVSGLLSQSRRKKVVRLLSRTAHLPHEERIVLLRKAVGGGAGARIIRLQVERSLADSKTTGLDRALSRRLPESKGLRPVLRNAPSVDWALPQPIAPDVLNPIELSEAQRSPQGRIASRSLHQDLTRSPVQEEALGGEGRPRRRRQSEAVLGRLDAAIAREANPEAVSSRIVQVSPGRFEPVSPLREASYIAPLGRDEAQLEEGEESVSSTETRSSRIKETLQPEAGDPLVSVVHKTPLPMKGRPTRWAAARLDAPATRSSFASSVPLLSSLPLPIARDAEEDGQFLKVDLSREEVAKLGIRKLQTSIPEMSLLEESAPRIDEEDESQGLPNRSSAPESMERERRPRWDRSDLVEDPKVVVDAPKALWPKPAPSRPGWRPVADDTVVSTTDHGWFRTPEGILVRSKGFRTPEGTWVNSPSYRTPQRQRALPGLRFEPVFPEFHEEATPLEASGPAPRPALRLARRAGWAPEESAEISAGRRTPANFDRNIRMLSEGRVSQEAPSWTERAVGGPKIRASSELIRHLAQARDPEEIIRLIVDRGQDLNRETSLAAPVVEVIKQIKGEAAKAESEPSLAGQSRGARVFSGGQRPSRAARRISGFRPLRGPGATRQNGMGEDRVMKLAGKLRGLVHLAEVENRRDEARKQARLSAEEAPEVRAPEAAAGGEVNSGDVQALIQEIVSAVNREMELRRERRQEDNHEPWW